MPLFIFETENTPVFEKYLSNFRKIWKKAEFFFVNLKKIGKSREVLYKFSNLVKHIKSK